MIGVLQIQNTLCDTILFYAMQPCRIVLHPHENSTKDASQIATVSFTKEIVDFHLSLRSITGGRLL